MNHSYEFTCPKCSTTFTKEFLIENLEEVSSDERGMGTETQYDFSEVIACPNCKHEIEILGEAWEYPQGAPLEQIEIKSYK